MLNCYHEYNRLWRQSTNHTMGQNHCRCLDGDFHHFATSMVAGIIKTLTISSLSSSTVTNIEQLSNQKVATISDSPSIEFLQEHQAKVIEQISNEAIDLLKRKIGKRWFMIVHNCCII